MRRRSCSPPHRADRRYTDSAFGAGRGLNRHSHGVASVASPASRRRGCQYAVSVRLIAVKTFGQSAAYDGCHAGRVSRLDIVCADARCRRRHRPPMVTITIPRELVVGQPVNPRPAIEAVRDRHRHDPRMLRIASECPHQTPRPNVAHSQPSHWRRVETPGRRRARDCGIAYQEAESRSRPNAFALS